MSIVFRVLGQAGRDNALLVQVDSGQAVERLLFDCGEGCLSELSFAEVTSIDHLFFSHLHMDHVGGFDSFFRCTFNRDTRPNHIWGPPETARIMQHRFEGFLWNLHEQMSATCALLMSILGKSAWPVSSFARPSQSDMTKGRDRTRGPSGTGLGAPWKP